jgi:hypothetical protein
LLASNGVSNRQPFRLKTSAVNKMGCSHNCFIKLRIRFLLIPGLWLTALQTVPATNVNVVISNDTPQIEYALRQLSARLQGLANTLIMKSTYALESYFWTWLDTNNVDNT